MNIMIMIIFGVNLLYLHFLFYLLLYIRGNFELSTFNKLENENEKKKKFEGIDAERKGNKRGKGAAEDVAFLMYCLICFYIFVSEKQCR